MELSCFIPLHHIPVYNPTAGTTPTGKSGGGSSGSVATSARTTGRAGDLRVRVLGRGVMRMLVLGAHL